MKNGLAIVTAVRDRIDHLIRVLPNWLAQDAVSQVVVCDFGSEPEISASIVGQNEKVKLVRAGKAETWNKGLAQNIGIEASDYDTILKSDCDVSYRDLEKYLYATTQGCFISGYIPVRNSKIDDSQAGCFGQVMFQRQDWHKIGGYNEFLQGWGFDDQDFYNRLRDNKIPHLFFDLSDLKDIPHDDEVRGGARFPDDIALAISPEIRREKAFQNMRNKFIAGIVPWNATYRRARVFRELAPKVFECILEAKSGLESRVQNVAAFLTCRFVMNCDQIEVELRRLLVDDRFFEFAADANLQSEKFTWSLMPADQPCFATVNASNRGN